VILQSLCEYYDRLLADPDSGIAPIGFQFVRFPFGIVLDASGAFVQFRDLRDGEGVGRRMLVAQAVKRSSGVKANLMWDKASYLFEVPTDDSEKRRKRAADQVQAFKSKIEETFPDEPRDKAVQAMLTFLDSGLTSNVEADPLWEEIKETDANLTFLLREDRGSVMERPAVKERLIDLANQSDENSEEVQCLVTGETGELQVLHPSIKNVWGAQSSGANIVSFNSSAVESYGLKRGGVAPVTRESSFAYTTVLNHLLRKNSPQRMQVGDASTVFWCAEPGHKMEMDFSSLMAGHPTKSNKTDVESEVQPIRDLLSSVQSGLLPDDELKPFYVLGLGPSASRIIVRFWHQGTVNDIKSRLAQHFEDIELDAGEKIPRWPRLFFLLTSTATEGKADNIQPNLGGNVIRAILSGQCYPRTFMLQALIRARSEQSVPHARACVMKACINRLIRNHHLQGKELAMSLDLENTNIGYLLGRLFATMERTQSLALGTDLNAGLRDRFYATASSAPTSVLPWLQKMNGQHLRKLKRDKPGAAVNLEKLIGEVYGKISADGVPSYLAPEDQCRFAVGYFHQRQDFFTKHDDSKTEKQEVVHV